MGRAAWSENPLLRRTMQAYLAGADTAGKLLADADLDWRDRERMQFVIDNVVEAFAPTNNPLLNPLGYKALIDTGGASAVRGMSNLARDLATKPRVPAMISSDAFTLGDTVATPGAVVYQSRVFEADPVHAAYSAGAQCAVADRPAGHQQVLRGGHGTRAQPGRVLPRSGPTSVRHLVAQPQGAPSGLGFDTYGEAIIDALDAVEQITGTDRTHLFATCSGGMLAAMTAAHLTDIGQGDRIAGLALGLNRARPEQGRLRCRRDERGHRQAGDPNVSYPRISRWAIAGGGVRLAASDRPGVAVLGEQLHPGSRTCTVRCAFLECRRPPGWPRHCTATWWNPAWRMRLRRLVA